MPGRKPAINFACIAVLGCALAPLLHIPANNSHLLGLAAKQVQTKQCLAARRTLGLVLAKDPNSAEAYNLLGICAASIGDYGAAQSAFQKSINLDSRSPAPHVNLGKLMLGMHNEHAALNQFKAALAIDPKALTQKSQSYEGFNLLGLCLMDEHRYDAARRAFMHCLWINPHYPPAHVNLGLALMALERNSEALQAFFSALTLQPEDPVVITNIGLIYARQGKFTAAVKYLRQAHGLAPDKTNVTAALAAADIECGRSGEAGVLIDDLARSGRLTAAMRVSLAASWLHRDEPERALPLVKGDSELTAWFCRAAFETAEVLFEKEQGVAALHLLEAIRGLRPPDSAYFALRGSAYYLLDRPKEASDSFQQAIRLDPSNVDDYFKLGMVFLKYHTYQPAISIFQSGLRSKPESATLWFGLGMSCYFASYTTEGERALRQAIGLDPNYAPTYIVLGDLLQQTGRFAEAAAVFQRAIHLQPDSFAPYYYFGGAAAHLGKGELNTAVTALRKAVRLNPMFAEAHYELGKGLAKEGQTSEAVKELRMSLELKPELAGSHYQLGRIFEKMGETALAQEQFRLFAAVSQKQHSHDLIRSLIVQIGKP